MKLKPPNRKKLPSKGITLFNTVDGIVEITHFQAIKQSIDYQSADASYGVKIKVLDNKKAVKKAARCAERVVEDLLSTKFNEQRDVLKSIAADNKR